MMPKPLKSISRELFRWYLNKFPLRDGKAYFYERLNETLMPEERCITAPLDKGFRMKFDLKDPEQRKIYFYGHYHERYETLLIERVLEEGEAFWDIGANVGYFVLAAAAALGNTGEVVAFEPFSVAYQNLLDNLALNHFTNIRPVKLAVSDTHGEVVLYASSDIADTSANIFMAKEDQAGQEVIQTITLDEFSQEMARLTPTLIKMDIEGAELAVLKGGRETIRASQPLLLIELEARTLRALGLSKADFQEELAPYGYQPAFLKKGTWQICQDLEAVKGRNIFWFNPDLDRHRHKAARIPIHGVT
jgi:FkbM family methyltransferase